MTHASRLLFVAAVALAGCARKPMGVPTHSPESEDLPERVRAFCGHCHAYPAPDTFPREHWKAEVERGYRFFEKSGLDLKPPKLAEVAWYYESRAPMKYAVPKVTHSPRPPRVTFEQVSYPGPPGSSRFSIAHVNLVHLSDPKKLDVLACDMANGYVMLLKPYGPAPSWRVLAKLSHPSHAEVVDLDGDGVKDVVVADLGSYQPTDRRCGSVVWLRGHKDGSFTPATLLDKVGRVADVQAAHFRTKDKLDLVVAVFGHQETGEILLLENETSDWGKPRFTPRLLDGRHGAIHVPVTDLDGDGRPDFVALISQEHETVVAFLARGVSRFEKKTLYDAPHPGYGSSGIQLVDMDGDGDLDVLYTNGDVLDRPYLFKPHHGVQWLENKGGLKFVHHPLTPLHGAHRAVAGDLNGDGKPDVVAVSFLPLDRFPTRAERNPDAVVLLEQAAGGKFDRRALKKTTCDHVTCALGDLYGTGRLDLVVGHFAASDTGAPVTIWKNIFRR